MKTAQDGGKVASLTHRPPLPQEILLVLISVRGCVDPQGHSAIGRIFMSVKNSSDTSWYRTSDLRFVAQHLNHCATAVPWLNIIVWKMCRRDLGAGGDNKVDLKK